MSKHNCYKCDLCKDMCNDEVRVKHTWFTLHTLDHNMDMEPDNIHVCNNCLKQLRKHLNNEKN